MSTLVRLGAALTFLSLSQAAVLQAAIANAAHEDIHFIAEHVPEAFQDARFYSLPWPASEQEIGRWRAHVDAGWVRANAGFFDFNGTLVLAGGSYRRSARAAIQLFGFFDSGSVGGGRGEQILRAEFLVTPALDLPERALFSNPRGTLRHWGLGGNFTYRASERWAVQAGLLASRFEARDYRFDFELLGGRNTALRAVLDHSSEASFATPYLGVERGWRPTSVWSLRARANAGLPLPEGRFTGRIFGLTIEGSNGAKQGNAERFGDAFIAVGISLLHAPSGLELDLGSSVLFYAFERAMHHGIGEALLLRIVWHQK